MTRTESTGQFEPKHHLIKLKGNKDYLPVAWRLVWLRLEHPDAIIKSKLERLELDGPKPIAVFSAYVAYRHYFTDGDGQQLVDALTGRPLFELAEATGWGQEEPKDFGDFLEKAETKAVGRALAALGFGTQFSEDWDEEVQIGAGGQTQNVVDAPVERGNARNGGTAAQNRQNNRGKAKPAVQTLNGVQFTVEEVEKNGRKVQTYKTVETCPKHEGKHFFATLTEGNQLSEWAHGDGKNEDGTSRRCLRA